MPQLEKLLRDALNLEIQDRAALAERLLASLDKLTGEEADRLWAEEAQRRLEQYHAGRANSVAAAEVAQKVKRLYR